MLIKAPKKYITAFFYFHKSSNDDARLNEFMFFSQNVPGERAAHLRESFQARAKLLHAFLLGHLSHVKELCRCATTKTDWAEGGKL